MSKCDVLCVVTCMGLQGPTLWQGQHISVSCRQEGFLSGGSEEVSQETSSFSVSAGLIIHHRVQSVAQNRHRTKDPNFFYIALKGEYTLFVCGSAHAWSFLAVCISR